MSPPKPEVQNAPMDVGEGPTEADDGTWLSSQRKHIRIKFEQAEMTLYTITEPDIYAIGVHNGQTTFWASLGSILLAFVLGMGWDISTALELNENTADALFKFGCMATFACYLVAIYHFVRQKLRYKRIRKTPLISSPPDPDTQADPHPPDKG